VSHAFGSLWRWVSFSLASGHYLVTILLLFHCSDTFPSRGLKMAVNDRMWVLDKSESFVLSAWLAQAVNVRREINRLLFWDWAEVKSAQAQTQEYSLAHFKNMQSTRTGRLIQQRHSAAPQASGWRLYSGRASHSPLEYSSLLYLA
jgi:hypothetical protein